MEKYFFNLDELVLEKEQINDRPAADKWIVVPYKTKLGEGKMLLAARGSRAGSITLPLGLSGWHRVFIAVVPFDHAEPQNYIYLRFSGDMCNACVRSSARTPRIWAPKEYIEEIYLKSADLTGQSLIVSHPADAWNPGSSTLAWIRCVPMSEHEINKHAADVARQDTKCVHAHIDEDAAYNDIICEDDYVMKLEQMKNTDVEMLSFETSGFYDIVLTRDEVLFGSEAYRVINGRCCDYLLKRDEIYKKIVENAHAYGIKILAAIRVSLQASGPNALAIHKIRFADEHPEYFCENRDGSVLKSCSYAYPEVQDFMIGWFKDVLQYGFDGVSLILHRGALLGFERPVAERFAKQYQGVAMEKLPMADPRLHGVWCGIMTEFIRKLRVQLDAFAGKRVWINAITDFGLNTSKHCGFDVEQWAREGLIDSACQADIEVYENIDECMSHTEPGLIDMEKYRAVIANRPVIERTYSNMEKVYRHLSEYKMLGEKYGIDTYHVLPWTGSVSPEKFAETAEKLRRAGAEKFFWWNTNHAAWNLPEFHTCSLLGRGLPEGVPLRTFVRTLSIDGLDISHYNPEWRG